VHTRPARTAVHSQEVTLSNPTESCERMRAEEVMERDGERAGAACYVIEHASVTQSVSHKEACKTSCAGTLHKANSTITWSTLQTPITPALLHSPSENQFNDYLEHATNTEHASLITLPPTNVHLRWTGVSHREACNTWCARTLQTTNSTFT